MRLGIHTSISGSIDRAAERAIELGAKTFQIFSTSPRSWHRRRLQRDEVARLRTLCRDYDLRPLIVHTNYLINLTARDPQLRRKSIEALRQELECARELGADYVVLHPGRPAPELRDEGLQMNIEALVEALHDFDVSAPTLLLENSAGSGVGLGASFQDLAVMRAGVQPNVKIRLGYCIDTAHCLAAGYDVASSEGWKRVVAEVEQVLGWSLVHVIHANDSRFPLGSRRDRHEHIGAGYIGRAGFRRILAEAALQTKPFILETPLEKPEDDRRNLRTLRQLCPRNRTITV